MTATLTAIPGGAAGRGDLDVMIDGFAVFIEGEGLALKTRTAYEKSARKFADWLADGNGPVFVAELKRKHLAAYMAHIASALTRSGRLPEKSTTATTYRHLQQWFRFLVEDGELEASPLENLKAQKAAKRPIPVITGDDLRALLDGCGNDFYGRRDEAIIRLMLDAGPRVSEVAGIDVADVHMKQRMIHVYGKGANGATKERDIPVGAKTANALARYERARAKHPRAAQPEFWIGHRRQRMTPDAIASMLIRRCEAAGIARINPHRFRHTFAHLFRKNGGHPHELMRIGGWESESMVRRYGESALDEEARETHRRISPGDMF